MGSFGQLLVSSHMPIEILHSAIHLFASQSIFGADDELVDVISGIVPLRWPFTSPSKCICAVLEYSRRVCLFW
jgi:hypothetical protein